MKYSNYTKEKFNKDLKDYIENRKLPRNRERLFNFTLFCMGIATLQRLVKYNKTHNINLLKKRV